MLKSFKRSSCCCGGKRMLGEALILGLLRGWEERRHQKATGWIESMVVNLDTEV